MHGGVLEIRQHASQSTGTDMRFSVFLPPAASQRRCPVVYFLAGLTCTEENFTVKSGAQRYAAELGLILVAPDTSPRGVTLPGDRDSWDFGVGAGFYVNATEEPWARHYRMYEYVARELPALIAAEFPARPGPAGIMGHSMGGHGALVVGLRNPDQFASISAFAPIAAPSECAWGIKAFTGYLGPDRAAWSAYDATALILAGKTKTLLLIDQGEDDEFLAKQLLIDRLRAACAEAHHPLQLKLRKGYDHSYYFIASFVGEHLAHHAQMLG